jgi:hypothetical protein
MRCSAVWVWLCSQFYYGKLWVLPLSHALRFDTLPEFLGISEWAELYWLYVGIWRYWSINFRNFYVYSDRPVGLFLSIISRSAVLFYHVCVIQRKYYNLVYWNRELTGQAWYRFLWFRKCSLAKIAFEWSALMLYISSQSNTGAVSWNKLRLPHTIFPVNHSHIPAIRRYITMVVEKASLNNLRMN